MASGWLLLTGGALWTLNSLGAGVWLGHWLARHNLISSPREEVDLPDVQITAAPDGHAENGAAQNHDQWSPLAGEVARGMAQAGAAVRKAEWLSSVCDETGLKPTSAIRSAVRELTGAVRTLHQQIGSIFSAFESLRHEGEAADLSLGSFPRDDGRGGIDLIGRRRRMGGFLPPPPPVRFPYPCREWVAPCIDERLPAASDFFAVQCRHLDKDGVAFYVDRVLPAETFVISLGVNGSRTFMLARVLSEHAQPDSAQGSYMLECRFVKHLGRDVYAWNPSKGVIEECNVAGGCNT
ncbi:MAG TPA: hypothetical protein VG826_13485 [Pirellulales bacterium]|nr:hypothetical protein [Pirellulales bacterium]